jgi:hypothetical protein
MDPKRRKAITVTTVVIITVIIVASTITIVTLNRGNKEQLTGSFPTDPLPAEWQKNLSGIPSNIEVASNGILYILLDANDSFGQNVVPWVLLAVQLNSGKVIWHHSLTLPSANTDPILHMVDGILYFIGTGESFMADGARKNVSGDAFIVSFNESDGHMGPTESIGVPIDFSTTGAYAVSGTSLYVAWTSLGGSNTTVAEYPLATNVSSPSPSWETRLKPPVQYNTNVPGIYLNDRMVLLDLWNLIGLNRTTGKELFSIPYPALHVDMDNVMNGALTNSTLYYVAEFTVSQNHTNINLIGLNTLTLNSSLNVTVGSTSIPSYPLAVRVTGSELVVDTSEGYVVTTLEGNVLWRSSVISYVNPSGTGKVSSGAVAAVLGNGYWMLTSVLSPSGKAGVSEQYFEEVNPSNGTLLWLQQFSFTAGNQSMFYPPNLMTNESVVVIAASGPYIIYRWGYDLGVAVIGPGTSLQGNGI